jgi:putative transposase
VAAHKIRAVVVTAVVLLAAVLHEARLRPAGATPTLRSDIRDAQARRNGLIFTSKRFRAACTFYRLSQEFITPYTPEQKGLVKRFFRSLKEEGVWQHNFAGFDEARLKIREWIDWYNQERPHQGLGYLTPVTFRQKQRELVV